ncbi:hypothetical protein C5167_043372 [Papaver somniferum]|uniref:Uncharacterized protein n=1 Tax=Papaver somniferum TaxID=3469 RepID=A0A4Y7L5I0_PAPSO|nr:hypothetical protein C5167_043372 [Papaver somniferum]
MLDIKFNELKAEIKSETKKLTFETITGKYEGSRMRKNVKNYHNDEKVKEDSFEEVKDDIFDEMGETMAQEKKLSQRLKKIERTLQKMGEDTIDIHGLYLYPDIRLPPGFEFPDMDRYDGTGCPKIHILVPKEFDWNDLEVSNEDRPKSSFDLGGYGRYVCETVYVGP